MRQGKSRFKTTRKSFMRKFGKTQQAEQARLQEIRIKDRCRHLAYSEQAYDGSTPAEES